jgi:hypothetical protein
VQLGKIAKEGGKTGKAPPSKYWIQSAAMSAKALLASYRSGTHQGSPQMGWTSTSQTKLADLRIGMQAVFAATPLKIGMPTSAAVQRTEAKMRFARAGLRDGAAAKRNDRRDVTGGETYQPVYGPDILARMGTAFDRAWIGLSGRVGDRDNARSKLARRIILHVDRGERDPDRIADLAMHDFLRT